MRIIVASDCDSFEGLPVSEIAIISNPMHEHVAENQVYRDKETLMEVMKSHAMRGNYQFKVDRSSGMRYGLVCIDAKCGWRFRASRLYKSSLFKVRTFNNIHTCSIEERLICQLRATYHVIGNLIKNNYANPKTVYTPANIIQHMKTVYKVNVNYMKAWRAKEKAIRILRGDPKESYTKLPSCLYMLRQSNPGSITKLHKDTDNSFKYVFVAVYASIKGWQYCRPVVVVDASFMKSAYGGTLITASTMDAAGKILPLGYAVVDSENNSSWEWFFESLMQNGQDMDLDLGALTCSGTCLGMTTKTSSRTLACSDSWRRGQLVLHPMVGPVFGDKTMPWRQVDSAGIDKLGRSCVQILNIGDKTALEHLPWQLLLDFDMKPKSTDSHAPDNLYNAELVGVT